MSLYATFPECNSGSHPRRHCYIHEMLFRETFFQVVLEEPSTEHKTEPLVMTNLHILITIFHTGSSVCMPIVVIFLSSILAKTKHWRKNITPIVTPKSDRCIPPYWFPLQMSNVSYHSFPQSFAISHYSHQEAHQVDTERRNLSDATFHSEPTGTLAKRRRGPSCRYMHARMLKPNELNRA